MANDDTGEQTSTAVSSGSAGTLPEQLPGPSGLPLLGSLLDVDFSRIHEILERWCERYGELFSFRLGAQRMVVIGDPELARRAFQERPHAFRRMGSMENVARELGLHGVFSAEGDDWRRQRKLILPAFKEDNLAATFPVMRTITERMLLLFDRLAAGREPIDVLHHLMRYTVDVTVAVAFGRDMNTLERGGDELQKQFETIFPMLNRRVLLPFPYWRYVKLPADRALDKALSAARAALLPLVESTRRTLEADAERARNPKTLLESMLLAVDEDGATARLSNEEVFANVMTLLLAGEDTTANTLAWMTYMLAMHPDVQHNVRAEADAVLGDARSLRERRDAERLRYLGAVAHETLRLKSPAPFVALQAVADITLGPLRLPAGTPVFLLTRHMAMRAQACEAPKIFSPDRWLMQGSGTPPQLARASLPFGAGPRVCPGRQLALLECGLVMSALAKNFEWTLEPGSSVTETFDFAMEPEGLRVRMKARSKRSG